MSYLAFAVMGLQLGIIGWCMWMLRGVRGRRNLCGLVAIILCQVPLAYGVANADATSELAAEHRELVRFLESYRLATAQSGPMASVESYPASEGNVVAWRKLP